MRVNAVLVLTLSAAVGLAGPVVPAAAQIPQLPTLEVCNVSKVEGKAEVKIAARKDATHAGVFALELKVSFNPMTDEYPPPPPASKLDLQVDLTDSAKGTIVATSFEQVTTTGKATPMVFISGRCKVDSSDKEKHLGCRFWVMIAANKRQDGQGTPDVISFLVVDKEGKRVAYGAGPVASGTINVAATSN
jgi:hypothetical protein